jgi:inner membrane protein
LALPVAHAAAGYLLHRAGGGADRPGAGFGRAVALMIVANLPDADFLVGFALGHPGLLHRGASHTVLAAVLCGVVAGAFARWRWRERFVPTALLFGAAYLSHVLIDVLTFDNRPPDGVQLLWPFSSEYLASPVTVFLSVDIDGKSRAGFLTSVFAWQTVAAMARELVIVVGAIACWQLVGRVKQRLVATGEGRALVSEGTEEDLA